LNQFFSLLLSVHSSVLGSLRVGFSSNINQGSN